MTNSRIGTFSSSSIWKLMTNGKAKDSLGKPALTYIKEKRYESKLGREIANEQGKRPTSWGDLVEQVAFVQLDNVENANEKERLSHPDLPWTGQPDYTNIELVGDIKCPFSLLSFCEMYEIETGEELKTIKPEYYWQLVSNSILANKQECELTIFVPLQEQLELIRELSKSIDGEEQNKFAWVNWAQDNELPYLLPDSYYKPLKQIKFTPSEQDKKDLIKRVTLATELLKS
jgi:hypothetical protein